MYLFVTNVTPVTVHMHECMDKYMCAYKHTHTQSNFKSLFQFGKQIIYWKMTNKNHTNIENFSSTFLNTSTNLIFQLSID